MTFTRYLIIHLVALLALAFVMIATVPIAHAQSAFTPDDTLQAIEDASRNSGVSYALLRAIVRCETGGTYSNYLTGAQGEIGAVQLHPRGALRDFYRVGYHNPYNPQEAVHFLADAIRGDVPGVNRGAWSC